MGVFDHLSDSVEVTPARPIILEPISTVAATPVFAEFALRAPAARAAKPRGRVATLTKMTRITLCTAVVAALAVVGAVAQTPSVAIIVPRDTTTLDGVDGI
jgi:hypothetical protein